MNYFSIFSIFFIVFSTSCRNQAQVHPSPNDILLDGGAPSQTLGNSPYPIFGNPTVQSISEGQFETELARFRQELAWTEQFTFEITNHQTTGGIRLSSHVVLEQSCLN